MIPLRTRPLVSASVGLALALAAGACGSPDVDTARSIPPGGVIRGTVTYAGPVPCTQAGHVVGNLILLVFDRRNPPPPAGIAQTPVNFAVVTGDVLFASLPRVATPARSCPLPGAAPTLASAPFTISPLAAGSYLVQAFYDTTGNFLPTFKIRNLPERGDVGGGYLDASDAAKHAGDPSYTPVFLPVNVGVPAPTDPTTLVMPDQGFVVDNVSVTVGATLPLPRPYFFPEGADALPPAPQPSPANPDGNVRFVPVATMTQDQQLFAPPAKPTPDALARLQTAFANLRLDWGVTDVERQAALDPLEPFHFQVPPFAAGGGLFVWARGGALPDAPAVPSLFPLVVLEKLVDDPTHALDAQGIVAQGARGEAPIVIIQGITLLGDSFISSALGTPPKSPAEPASRVDHVTALVRPSVLCFDPAHVDRGALLVTPHVTGPSADPTEVVPPEGKPLFDPAAVQAAAGKLVRELRMGCLPTGHYAINLVYPTGQAWTTPNEAGSCASSEGEGTKISGQALAQCTQKPRAVLGSQGTRGVVEIVAPTTDAGKQWCQDHPVPVECLPAR